MKKQVLLIHGRPPGATDANTLKTQWLDAWQLGLKRGNLSVPDAEIRFAYYGDLLGEPSRPGEPDSGTEGASEPDSPGDQFRLAVLEEIASHRNVINFQPRGIPAREKVRRLLQAFTEAEISNVSLMLQLVDDLQRYTTDATLRAAFLERLCQHVDVARPVVVVAHAVGAVFAYDALDNWATQAWQIPLMVTLAAPLGIAAIRDRFGMPRLPGAVARWCNARDPEDIVPLLPLDLTHFPLPPPASILDKSDVRNRTTDHHAIQGYLNDPEVVRWIHFALS